MLLPVPRSRPPNWPLLYTAVALTTLATLLLELSLTRIFSVVFYYHFAFLAISIALFGLGAGGVLSYVVSGWSGSLYRKLGFVSLINAGLVLAAVMFVLTRGAEIGTFDLGVIYFTTALPFLGSGIIVSLVIAETIERVDRIYFFDLLGAAGGCLALVLLLNTFGGPNTVIAVSVLFASAAAIWFTLAGVRSGRIASVFVGLLFTMLVIGNTKYHFLEVRYAKGEKLHTEQFTKWNSISRIGMAKTRRRRDDFHRRRRFHRHRKFRLQPSLAHRSRVPAAPGSEHPLQPAAGRENAGDRAGRRLGYFARARFGKPRCHGRRDQSHHRHRHHAEEISAVEPAALSPAGRAYPHRRRAQFRAAQRGKVSGYSGHAGGYMGLDGRRRVCSFREQPLHDRGVSGLSFASDRRWIADVHALGFRSAARVAPAGFAGD